MGLWSPKRTAEHPRGLSAWPAGFACLSAQAGSSLCPNVQKKETAIKAASNGIYATPNGSKMEPNGTRPSACKVMSVCADQPHHRLRGAPAAQVPACEVWQVEVLNASTAIQAGAA